MTNCVEFTYKEVEQYTDGFSEANFIGKFQFGRVYRGKAQQVQGSPEGGAIEFMVKIYEDPIIYKVDHPEDNEFRRRIEYCEIARKCHPVSVKPIKLYKEGENDVAAVFVFNPLDSVHNLLLKDTFKWPHRIKVALEVASLLEYLHYPTKYDWPCLVCNLSAAHIMLDQDYNSKLIDYGLCCPHDSRDLFEGIFGCYGYIDPAFAKTGSAWSEKTDVFAFGVLLLELIAKRANDPEKDRKNVNAPLVHEWAWDQYKSNTSVNCFGWSKCSLVHQSLEAEPDFYFSDGHKITKLAMQCVRYRPHKRPTMRQVLDCLLDLRVVQHNANRLGTEQLVRGSDHKPDEVDLADVVEQIFRKVGLRRHFRDLPYGLGLA